MLGGICSFAAIFQKQEVAILDFEMVFGDMPEVGRVSLHYENVCYT